MSFHAAWRKVRCCPFPLATPAMDSVLQDAGVKTVFSPCSSLPGGPSAADDLSGCRGPPHGPCLPSCKKSLGEGAGWELWVELGAFRGWFDLISIRWWLHNVFKLSLIWRVRSLWRLAMWITMSCLQCSRNSQKGRLLYHFITVPRSASHRVLICINYDIIMIY